MSFNVKINVKKLDALLGNTQVTARAKATAVLFRIIMSKLSPLWRELMETPPCER